MDRICYCASEEELEKAEEMAEPWGIPIQVGDSDKTKVLEFDRSVTQIIQIPTRQYLWLSSANLRVNNPLLVTYKDEFKGATDIWAETHLLTNIPPRGDVVTQYLPSPTANKYSKSFRIRPEYIGEYELRIHDTDGVIANDRFVVRR